MFCTFLNFRGGGSKSAMFCHNAATRMTGVTSGGWLWWPSDSKTITSKGYANGIFFIYLECPNLSFYRCRHVLLSPESHALTLTWKWLFQNQMLVTRKRGMSIEHFWLRIVQINLTWSCVYHNWHTLYKIYRLVVLSFSSAMSPTCTSEIWHSTSNLSLLIISHTFRSRHHMSNYIYVVKDREKSVFGSEYTSFDTWGPPCMRPTRETGWLNYFDFLSLYCKTY